MSLRLGNTIIPAVRFKLSSGSSNFQMKTVDPTAAMQNITADSGYDALSRVTINPIQTETKSINANGTYTPSSGKFFSSVTVNVSGSGTTILNQNKTVNPSTSQQTITADSGYTGLGTVTINAMPTGVAKAPTTIDGSSASITTGTNTLTLQKTVSVTPSIPTTGYISSGTATNSTVTLTASVTTKAAATITPTTTNQTIASGTYLTGAQTISGDTNLVAGNIKSGVSIFGVAGSYTGSAGITINNQNKSVTPTESEQSITADSGYTGLGTVTVGAISSTYVGSGITTRNASSLTASGATVTVPAGYYASQATKSVASGSAGTPTATKGTVSNHSISITPSVTNTTGYITGGTKTGNAVTVTANELVSGNKAITANGTGIDVANYATVSVNVSSNSPLLYDESVSYTPTETEQVETVNPDTGYDGFTSVTVTVGAIDSDYVGSGVTRQAAKTVTPSTSSQTAVASGVYTTGAITVAAIPNNYVNVSSITKSSSDLIVSDATVTAPAGYYPSNASASVTTMTLPDAISSTRSYTNKLTINRSTSAQYLNIPAGYNSTAASYTISAVANGSVTAPSTISGTSASISTGTNTITLSKTISVTPNVTTSGFISSGTAGNSSVTLTASVTTKAAATITPGTSNQTIASGTYLTGTQTISGDADLTAANIKTGVQIFGVNGTFTSDATAAAGDIADGKTAYINGSKVTGNLTFITYRTGTSTPTASLGNNGDIYLKTS